MKISFDITSLISDAKLLDMALTHRSWVNENLGIRGTNERLEFLGDAVLEFAVSEKLYKLFPDKEEGYLTALRANIVNTKNLSELAKRINLGDLIFLSKGEIDGGGRDNPSLLADTVEALIGAIYLDQGLNKSSDFIDKYLLYDIEKRAQMPLKDPKSLFQEYVQSQKLPTPRYQVVSESGPDHAKNFVIEVVVNNKSIAQGSGKSKAEAEQAAAAKALDVEAKVS
jgi:ribonuclease-3